MLDPASRKRLGQLLAMGSSAHDGELANALRLADRLVRQAGLTFEQILLHNDEARPGSRSAQALAHENVLLRGENGALHRQIEELRHENNQLRQRRGVPRREANGADNHQAQAHWIVELWQAGEVRLNQFERDFIGTVLDWDGPLTAKQQPIFDGILRGVVERTGGSPPS
jgi:hypothetical protein